MELQEQGGVTLTDEQAAVVASDHPLIVCIGCPGSAKTTVLTERIKRLIAQGLAPEAICACTYTIAASMEIQSRVGVVLGHCGTLHGFCLSFLSRYGDRIGFEPSTMVVLSEEDSQTFIEQQCAILKYRGSAHYLRLAMLDGMPQGERMNAVDLMVGRIYTTLRRTNTLTFDSILVYGGELIKKLNTWGLNDTRIHQHNGTSHCWSGFEHILCDEVQDFSALDWSIIEALPIRNRFYVGDPLQSVMEWRRGSPQKLIELSKMKAIVETHNLRQNFRSGGPIVEAANALSYHMHGVDTPPMVTADPMGTVEVQGFKDAHAEVLHIAAMVSTYECRCAILVRTNSLIEWIKEEWERMGWGGLDRVDILTYFASKSREWDIVFIPCLEDGICPMAGDDVNELRRCLYVAITRAKHTVYLTWAKSRRLKWEFKASERQPSPFLRELGYGLWV